MGRFALLSLALFSLQTLFQGCLAAETSADEAAPAPSLAVSVQASFPSSEIFGIKLVNGQPTQALLAFTNEEDVPITVNFVGGSLATLDEPSRNVRNLSATNYGVQIPAGETQTLPYSLTTEMHPQDLRLNLISVVSKNVTQFFTIQAFNGTVSVVEPETSIFDPQIIFLYFFILAFFVGIFYFFYTVWIAPYFPQKRRGRESKKAIVKKTDLDVPSPDAAAVPTTAYNSDWIPAHHIQKPEARKVKGARSKSRA
ncbi:translocon-associated protein, alpha subunit, putative [Talaromyces stipitatus ATCC 10500]|uniref:Translocon-associated protein, alpha subunit, putative n=1 Tax=Talaromyces stipitatus (strain ATCC 10500 / CBS 375.48 / QM 6759 / NRRL 1006) TaxID=441959 RepID=B8MQ01_TALSN|nr:translocon-associated protein, alpha subunit, putative [Talaromyces stipitatus ATCC 10500]EED12891.1 translocon-associated protein, alpha subunit, putative [Talaromyces stipitatus ATCC 10500]